MSMNRMKTGAAVLCALTLIACGTDSPSTPTGGSEKKIVFEVTGPPAADITYGIGGSQSQKIDQKLPFREETSSSDALLIAVLTAQSKSDGEITCRITVDGKVVKENKSSGQFAVVTCTS